MVYIWYMLEGIFGNKTAEKALLHIFHYGEIHASAIAEDYAMSKTPIINQLNRFENAGILVSKQVGRSRVYALNQKNPYYGPIREILRIAYESIPLEERMNIYKTRRKGKPLYG